MKTLITIITLLTTSLISRADIYMITGPIVNPQNAHAYYLLSPSAWTQAEEVAVSLGGHLVTISDVSEENWVCNTFSMFGGASRSLWIGFSDAAQEGHFAWVTGEPVYYTRWSPGEPNNLNDEDYVVICPPTDPRAGLWNDILDDGWGGGGSDFCPNGVVEVIPEPSALALLGIGVSFTAVVVRRRQLRRA